MTLQPVFVRSTLAGGKGRRSPFLAVLAVALLVLIVVGVGRQLAASDGGTTPVSTFSSAPPAVSTDLPAVTAADGPSGSQAQYPASRDGVRGHIDATLDTVCDPVVTGEPVGGSQPVAEAPVLSASR